jgi:hypothetical protein
MSLTITLSGPEAAEQQARTALAAALTADELAEIAAAEARSWSELRGPPAPSATAMTHRQTASERHGYDRGGGPCCEAQTTTLAAAIGLLA